MSCCRNLLFCAVVAAILPARSAVADGASQTVGIGDVEVVVPADAPKTVRFAAKELKGFLDAALGGDVPVSSEPGAGKTAFMLGERLWREAGFTTNGWSRDAFVIRTRRNRVFIAGFDDAQADPEYAIAKCGVWGQLYARSTLFGVYEFAERVLGVRMYFPGPLGTIVPKAKALEIPEMDILVKPDFLDRSVATYLDGAWFENVTTNRHSNWPEKTLQSYRLRMQTDMKPCCHGSLYFKYGDRFWTSHPEYFAALPCKTGGLDRALGRTSGHLCWTSGIREEIYCDVRSYLKGEPPSVRGVTPWMRTGDPLWPANCRGGKYVDIMPADGFQPCQCAKCKAAYVHGDDNYASELIWGVVAEIGNRLKAEGIAGRIVMMAYRPYRRVPSIKLPDNVDVMIGEAGPWSVADPVRLKVEADEIRSWTEKLGHKVWCWNYPSKWGKISMPDIPQLSMRAYAAYYKKMAPYITGAYAESSSDRAIYNYLNYYVYSKVCWDNSADVERILDEHHRLMFGSAAIEMTKFYNVLEMLWTKKIGGRTIDTAIGPVGSPPSDYEMWYRIYSPKVVKVLERVLVKAAAKVPADSLEASRIALVRRDFFEPLARRAGEYVAATDVSRALPKRLADGGRSILDPGEWSVGRIEGLSWDSKCRLVWPASLKLTTTNETGVGGYQKLAGTGSSNGKLIPNVKYRISFFVKTENVVAYSRWGGVALNVWSDQNHFFPRDNWFSGTQDWIFQSYEFATGPHTNEMKSNPARILPRLVNCSGTAWFDDIRLEVVE
ncbi:MAG: DUF4838 domain-containing protein [Kiritimatiellae bacterium]|nr:DUF4838 domain-containing protein [Kiritimatiellia bacterium]